MNIGDTFGQHSGNIGAISIIAILFGIIYAIIIGWLKQKELLEGYTAIAVIVGVLITLILASFIIGLESTLFVLLIFACTGAPMVMGSMWSYTSKRNQTATELRKLMGGDNVN